MQFQNENWIAKSKMHFQTKHWIAIWMKKPKKQQFEMQLI